MVRPSILKLGTTNRTLGSALLGAAAMSIIKSNAHALEEENTSGKKGKENEREFYVQISNFEQLKKAASVEKQEQWSFKIPKTDDNAGGGAIRARKIESNGVVKYVFTIKVILDQGLRDDCSVETTEDMFELFKVLCEKGMIKDRYNFPVEGTDLVYEVDLFRMPDGSYAPWAKIDLENPPEQPPPLPITVDAFIDGKTKDPEQKKQITKLYEQYFLTNNQLLEGGQGVTGPAVLPPSDSTAATPGAPTEPPKPKETEEAPVQPEATDEPAEQPPANSPVEPAATSEVSDGDKQTPDANSEQGKEGEKTPEDEPGENKPVTESLSDRLFSRARARHRK